MTVLSKSHAASGTVSIASL
ncbi:ABC transporter, partial [Phytophthora megakarya]